jgi:hypothetical protein
LLAQTGFPPELSGDLDGIDALRLPPGDLIAGAMQVTVMDAAERHRELIAHFAAQRARLHEAQMMGIAGLAPTDQAGLPGHVAQMVLVAIAARCGDREDALVDPPPLMAIVTILLMRVVRSFELFGGLEG